MSQLKIRIIICSVVFFCLLILGLISKASLEASFWVSLVVAVLLFAFLKPKKEKEEQNISSRTCVICGAPLRSRIKYCSKCRPTGRAKPYNS